MNQQFLNSADSINLEGIVKKSKIICHKICTVKTLSILDYYSELGYLINKPVFCFFFVKQKIIYVPCISCIICTLGTEMLTQGGLFREVKCLP